MKKSNQDNKRNYKPSKIGESLKSINKNLLYKFGQLDYIIHAKWPEIVGSFFVTHSKPEKITTLPKSSFKNNEIVHQKILHVHVNPAAAIEFQHFQNKIIDKINSFFGYQAIHNIKIHQKLYSTNSPLETKKNIKKNHNLNIKKAEIKDTTNKINDKELGESLTKLGLSIAINYEED